ncbi:hypothetical protein WA026_007743 [Henosepilachna vigintioctopunctata]|uniref:Uncharacterized protein n=1 Tax=Henosepilachna vigintioctopunctata TaxID=420089 RepID=A0AAW1U479_9CUCU
MKFARKACYSVSDVTVRNCFKKAGFNISPAGQDFLPGENEVEVGPKYDEWAKLVSHDHNTTGDVSIPTFEDFVQIDDDVTTAGEYTDDDIVQNCVRRVLIEMTVKMKPISFTIWIRNKRKFRRNKML